MQRLLNIVQGHSQKQVSPSNTIFFGPGGVGKTVTAALLAVGLSKEQHNRAGITLVDPESIAQFIEPICAVEGVPLFVEPSRSFVDMREALPRAVERGCCAFVVDHYDGVYRELSEAQKAALNLQGRQRPYHHREELVRLWDEWVIGYRAAPIHAIFTARQAWDWGDDEDAEGDPIKIKLGAKARGDGDANYESNLLIEMERIDNFSRERKSKRRIGQIEHIARVVKDRRMVLNGLSFVWKDLNGYTKEGGYKAVWKALAPHFSPSPARGTAGLLRPESTPRASTGLFSSVTGESRFAERAKRVAIAVEELQASLTTIWPGSTNEDKRLKNIVLETLFQSRSWTAIETRTPEVVESAFQIMQAFEREAVAINVKDEAKVIELIQSCKDAQVARIEALSF